MYFELICKYTVCLSYDHYIYYCCLLIFYLNRDFSNNEITEIEDGAFHGASQMTDLLVTFKLLFNNFYSFLSTETYL